MVKSFTDAEIEQLLLERKDLPEDYLIRMRLRPKRGHKERDVDVVGEKGNKFLVILRQSLSNIFDFSVILAYCPKGTNDVFRLRRYNGKSHQHTNGIEHTTFYDFHIHRATERYQDLGSREDAFAEPTSRFSDFDSALSCMLHDCGFRMKAEGQPSLFEET